MAHSAGGSGVADADVDDRPDDTSPRPADVDNADCHRHNNTNSHRYQDDQLDEVELLQSMFPEPGRVEVLDSPDSTNEDSQKLYSILVNIHVKTEGPVSVHAWVPFEEDSCPKPKGTPSALRPKFERSLSGRKWLCSFEVNHLSPISLHVILPPAYPSVRPPEFTMSCLWLSATQLQVLCHQLDALWGESYGMPVLYTWMDWLEHNTLSHLAITDSVILTPHLTEDDATKDPRGIVQCVDLEIDIGSMLRHDLNEEIAGFHRGSHICEICFEEKTGPESILLIDCRHHFCIQCLQDYTTMLVAEGNVLQINCPDSECKMGLPFDTIRTLLSDEDFTRYERLLLQKTIDSLEDIEWCPRCNHVSLRDQQKGLQLAICTECNFSYCTECRESWHQGSPCFSKFELLNKNFKPRNGQKNKKNDPTQAAKRFENYLSSSYINTNARRCPKCNVPIVKYDGCNKVVCTRCSATMCWSCGKLIKGYDHFGKSCETFGYRANIADRFRYGNVEPEGAVRIRKAMMTDPQTWKLLVPCPRCRQNCMKANRNNHIQCWACKTNFCAMCRKRIEGTLSHHYIAGSGCVQHSD